MSQAELLWQIIVLVELGTTGPETCGVMERG